MALLQRLIADEKCGLNYDYMGFAEFEFGATGRARVELARFMIDGTITARRINFKGKWGVTNVQFPAIVIGEKEFIDNIKPELSLTMEKSFMRDRDEKILGWMNLGDGYHKFVVFRDDENYPANVDRLEKFLKQVAEDRRVSGCLGGNGQFKNAEVNPSR